MDNFIKNLLENERILMVDARILEENMMDLKNEFSFLNISPRLWEQLFIVVEKELAHFNIDTFVNKLRNRLEIVIKNNCAKENTSILEAYLEQEITNKTYLKTLLNFYSFLKKYRINFNESYFQKLKARDGLFNKILKALGASDFSYRQVREIVDGKYDLELAMKPQDKELYWVRSMEYYVLDFMDGFDLSMVNKISFSSFLNSEIAKRLKFILAHYEMIMKIHEEYEKVIGKVAPHIYQKLVFNFSLGELNQLVNDFIKYNSFKAMNINDNTLFNRLYSKLKLMDTNDNNNELDKVKEPKRQIIDNYNFDIQNDEDLIEALCQIIEVNIPYEEKKNIIAEAYKKMQNNKISLKDYLGGDTSIEAKQRSFVALKYIRNYISRYLKREETLNENKESVYKLFLGDNANDLERRKLVDIILKEESSEMLKYYSMEASSQLEDEKTKIEINDRINMLKKKYGFDKKEKRGKKRSWDSIYEYILRDNINDLEKRNILNQLLNTLTEEERIKIDLYYKDKIDYNGVKNIIANLKQKYERKINKKNKLLGRNKLYKNVYEYILKEDVNDTEKREILTRLLNDLTEDDRTKIDLYYKDEINCMEVHKILLNLKQKYDRRKSMAGNLGKRRKIYNNIYEYILREDINNLEKRMLLTHLLNELSKEERKKITLYYKNDQADPEAKKIIFNLRKRYERRKNKAKVKGIRENKSGGRKKTYKNIYEYVLKKDINDLEKKDILIQLLNDLTEEERGKIELYYKNELNSTEVRNIIANLKLKYDRRKDKTENFRGRKKDYKDIYDYILKEDVNDLEKREMLNYLLEALTPEEREKIDLYYKNEIRYDEIKNIVGNLKNRYNKLCTNKEINIYALFPRENFDEFIGRILITNLDKEEQELLKQYIITKESNSVVVQLINLLLKSYKYYLEYKVLPSYYYLENLFININREWFAKQYEKFTKKKIDLYTKILRLLEYKYKMLNIEGDFSIYLKELVNSSILAGLDFESMINNIKQEIKGEDYTR